MQLKLIDFLKTNGSLQNEIKMCRICTSNVSCGSGEMVCGERMRAFVSSPRPFVYLNIALNTKLQTIRVARNLKKYCFADPNCHVQLRTSPGIIVRLFALLRLGRLGGVQITNVPFEIKTGRFIKIWPFMEMQSQRS